MPHRAQTEPSPKSLIDKLGVKEGHSVMVVSVRDAGFRAQLRGRRATIATNKGSELDMVFYSADRRPRLGRLRALRGAIKQNGSVWVVFPKGSSTIKLTDVILAAKQAGLVDTKVVSFSPTLTALKLVIPLAQRGK